MLVECLGVRKDVVPVLRRLLSRARRQGCALEVIRTQLGGAAASSGVRRRRTSAPTTDADNEFEPGTPQVRT